MPFAHISCKKVGWAEGRVGGKAGLRIAYSNQKDIKPGKSLDRGKLDGITCAVVMVV